MFSLFFNDEMCLTDSHLHLSEVLNFSDDFYETLLNKNPNLKIKICSCAHFPTEFKKQNQIAEKLNSLKNIKVFCSYGLHPQNKTLLSQENLSFFDDLLKENKLNAIGECGFDLFSQEFRENFIEQKKAFELCIEYAKKYNLPLVIHNRKGIQEIFKYLGELKKIKSVVFHSFSYGTNEANFILKNKVNAFFSYGKTLLLGSKKYESSFKSVPLDRILLETDSPFMRSKNQEFTSPSEILNVYKKAFSLREKNPEILCKIISENFDRAFCC